MKVKRTSGYLKLVNAKNPYDAGKMFRKVATETIDSNGYQVDARIMDDLEDMFAAAGAAGRNPVICSGVQGLGYPGISLSEQDTAGHGRRRSAGGSGSSGGRNRSGGAGVPASIRSVWLWILYLRNI